MNKLPSGHRIGLVPDFYNPPPARAGMEVFSHNLLRTLGSQVYEFEFVVFMNREHRGHLADLPPQFKIVKLKPPASQPLAEVLWYLFALPALAKAHRIDLLHFFSGNRRIGMYYPTRTLITVHDLHHFDHSEFYTLPRHLYCRHLISPILKRARYLTAISRATATQLHAKLNIPFDRIQVIENGCDPAFFSEGVELGRVAELRQRYSLDRDFLLYVSVLDHPRKNHINLLRAFREVIQHHDLVLLLVGEDFWQADVIQREIRDLGLSQRVKRISAVPREDLAALYQIATLFVHPSLYEGYGLPLVEAMASGLPVVCSRTPVFTEVAGDCALYFDAEDSSDITKNILQALSDPEQCDRMRRAGRIRVQGKTWQAATTRLTDLYREILRGPSP